MSKFETIERDGVGYYVIEGQEIPRVTSIIGNTVDKPWLEPWTKKVGGKKNAERIKRNSAYVGTMFHWRREAEDLHPVVPELPGQIDWSVVSSDENIKLLEIAETIWTDLGIKFERPHLVEETVYYLDPLEGSAGTADRMGMILDTRDQIQEYARGRRMPDFDPSCPTITDFKTSGQYKKEYGIQTAAYRLNGREMGLGEFPQALLIGVHPYAHMEVSWRAQSKYPGFWLRVIDEDELDSLEEEWMDIRAQFQNRMDMKKFQHGMAQEGQHERK